MKDFYSVLSLSRDASEKEIKKRFRELVRERHPDRFRGPEKEQAEAEFQEITEAFNVLTDSERRAELDAMLSRPADRGADHQQQGKVLLARGVKAYKEEDYLEAASNFHRATESDPRSAKNWYHLALACAHEKRWLPKGLEAIDRAMDLTPDHPPYLKLAGKLYALDGQKSRARDLYRKALEIGSHDPEIGKALAELGGPPETSKRGGSDPDRGRESGKGRLFGKLF